MASTNEDSLKVNYNEDTKSFEITWDKNDPKWSFLNDLDDDQLHFIKEALLYGIQKNILEEEP